MKSASQEVLDGIADFDSATIFNAVVKCMGGSQGGTEIAIPVNYTGPELRSHMSDMGVVVGYAVTAEVTCIDPDSEPLDWTPTTTCSTRPKVRLSPCSGTSIRVRAAAPRSATAWRPCTRRSAPRALSWTARYATWRGSGRSAMPMWSTGVVPGHGVFNLTRIGVSVTVAGLRILPGELLVADGDGCTKVPAGMAPEDVLQAAREIRAFESTVRVSR